MTREEKTNEVLAALEAVGGKTLADHWAWEMTPMPVALPSDEQLKEGYELVARAAIELSETRLTRATR